MDSFSFVTVVFCCIALALLFLLAFSDRRNFKNSVPGPIVLEWPYDQDSIHLAVEDMLKLLIEKSMLTRSQCQGLKDDFIKIMITKMCERQAQINRKFLKKTCANCFHSGGVPANCNIAKWLVCMDSDRDCDEYTIRTFPEFAKKLSRDISYWKQAENK